jgi:hypothetical protein
MPLVMRSSAAFSRLIESSIGLFSEGTWSARGWRWPTGASPGSNCCPEFVERGAAGFREPAVCAIATEVSSRASNAIVVINFRILGFPELGPLPIMVTGSSITRCGKPHVLFRSSSARGRCKQKTWVSASAISAKATGRNRMGSFRFRRARCAPA